MALPSITHWKAPSSGSQGALLGNSLIYSSDCAGISGVNEGNEWQMSMSQQKTWQVVVIR